MLLSKSQKSKNKRKLSYLHILPPIVIRSVLIWRVVTVLLTRAASPVARSEELVPHEGFEMSRKSPETVIEIFRDNLSIEKVSIFPDSTSLIIESIPELQFTRRK